MKISVIVPAYNESTTIDRCIKNLLDGDKSDSIEINVVCNGCTDNTADIARKYEPKINVVELAEGSKIAALNKGDSLSSYFPRFYIDADVLVSQESLWYVAKKLEKEKFLAGAPKLLINVDNTSKIVKIYYNVWQKTPYVKKGMLGTGFYGMSEKGRKRFNTFPDIISDDGYVRLQFAPEERKTFEEVTFTMFPPRNLYWLIAINTRAMLGVIELKKKYPNLFKNEEGGHPFFIINQLLKKDSSIKTFIYILVRVIIRLNALTRLFFISKQKWDHDLSSRNTNESLLKNR